MEPIARFRLDWINGVKILMIDALGVLGQARYDLKLCENLAGLFDVRDIVLEVPENYEYDSSWFAIRRSSRHMAKQLGKVSRTREYVKWLKGIAARARQWQPDIIHWQFGFFSLFDYFATRRLKAALPQARVVITLHDARPVRPTWNNVIARKRFFRTADGVVVHSEEAQDDFCKWIGTLPQQGAVKVIPHGPYAISESPDLAPEDIRRHFGLDLQGPVIISIGSLNENKDFGRSLQLVVELQKLCPSLHYLIGGSSGGRDLGPLLEQKNKAPSPERIVILDRYLTDEEVDQAHRIADFSLLIYQVSATSGAAVRSLCAGVPVISNDRPGFLAVVKDGVNGFIAEEGDQAAVARRIYRTLADPEALKAMKEKALASYQGITWDQVAREHYNFYRELLGSRA